MLHNESPNLVEKGSHKKMTKKFTHCVNYGGGVSKISNCEPQKSRFYS